jgi:hypothetical protein
VHRAEATEEGIRTVRPARRCVTGYFPAGRAAPIIVRSACIANQPRWSADPYRTA